MPNQKNWNISNQFNFILIFLNQIQISAPCLMFSNKQCSASSLKQYEARAVYTNERIEP